MDQYCIMTATLYKKYQTMLRQSSTVCYPDLQSHWFLALRRGKQSEKKMYVYNFIRNFIGEVRTGIKPAKASY